MASLLIRPVWNAATRRFRNLVTGRFISSKVAAPLLRAQGGAFRDALGRFIPNRFLGGEVVRQWPTGAADLAAVTRAIEGSPLTVPYRSRDIAIANVPYIHPTEDRLEVSVYMPKGREYDDDIFRENLAHRLVKIREEDTPELTEMPEILEDEITWEITTVYEEGAYLGGDVARFEG